MAKTPEVRIKVYDLDRLMRLDPIRERVWMYYKRREGADGKAYGKSITIAEWAGYTSPTSPQSVKNARSWLKRNGWLKPNGRSKSGLPMYLAVIPRLPQEADEGNLQIAPPSSTDYPTVISTLREGSSTDYTEVPTLKEQPESSNLKDSALTSGLVSKLVSADDSLRSSSSSSPTSNAQTSNVKASGDRAETKQEQPQDQDDYLNYNEMEPKDQQHVDVVLDNPRLLTLFGMRYWNDEHVLYGNSREQYFRRNRKRLKRAECLFFSQVHDI
jgi:hypothetical protein